MSEQVETPKPGEERTEIEREIEETERTVKDVPERNDPDTEKRPQDEPSREGR